MSTDEQFDGFYREILQRGQGIENMFISAFSFLRRQSDFFEHSDQGFEFVKKAFERERAKYQEKKRKEEEKKAKLEKEKAEKAKQTQTGEKPQSEVKEITKEEFERIKQKEKEEREKAEAKKNAPVEEVKEESKEAEKKDDKEKAEDDEEKERKKKLTPMDEELRKELLKRTEGFDDKNGGRSKYYTWNQPQIEQFEMLVPLDKDTKGSDIKVEYDSKHLKIKVKGEYIVNGELYGAINADSLFWNIDESKGKKFISITFDKIHRMTWWDYVIKGDDILSLSKINPEASKLSDLDPSMRPEVEKMMIENSYKMQGKPFHKDPKTNDVLQSFMKQHPEMDFSKVKIN